MDQDRSGDGVRQHRRLKDRSLGQGHCPTVGAEQGSDTKGNDLVELSFALLAVN